MIVSPKVGRGAAVILSALIVFIGWLVATFAGRAAKCSCSPDNTIFEWQGWLTAGAVAGLALFAGFEPLIAERLRRSGDSRLLGGVTRLWRLVATPFSWLFSAVDWFFAKVLAFVAGATARPWPLRYGILILWLLSGGLAGWFAPPALTLLGAPLGLWATGLATLIVFAVARRWSWVEGDREIFMVAQREEAQLTRIGFREDLRDEALFAIAALILLVPIG
ncbi:MAG: hypothetical protein AAFR16_11385, partial [Pseudomonadota bacterium]